MLAGHRELFGNLKLETAGLADAERVVVGSLPRAFRRPVKESEIARYVSLMKRALDVNARLDLALRVGLRAILCSPGFLFLSEPTDAESQRIDEYAQASRLSYFLWSTMPDVKLLDLASRGKLSQPTVLHSEVERMLSSPKAAAFSKNFTGQWLRLREITFNEPDQILFPEFDALLQFSMVEEATRFFDEVSTSLPSRRSCIERRDWRAQVSSLTVSGFRRRSVRHRFPN